MSQKGEHDLLVEIHFYDGGLQSRLFPAVSRPDWLLETEASSLPSDIQLEPSQGVFGFGRASASPNRTVTRLGWYEASVDRQFGARGNYAATLIWLRDCCLSDQEANLRQIRFATGLLARDGLDSQLEEKLSKFVDKLRTKAISNTRIPRFFTGVLPKPTRRDFDSFKLYGVYEPNNQVAPEIIQACADLQFANRPFCEGSAVFILQDATAKPTEGFQELPSHFELSVQLSERLVDIMDTQESKIRSLEDRSIELASENQELRERLVATEDGLKRCRSDASIQYAHFERDKQRLNDECASLREDLRQHRDINDQVAQLVSAKLERKLSRIESDIKDRFSNIEARLGSKPANTSGGKKPTLSNEVYSWIIVLFIISCLGVVIIWLCDFL